MSDMVDNFRPIVTSFLFLCVIMFVLGYLIGGNKSVDNFVNKVCQQTQYEFCQPTYTYKAKGKEQ